MVKWADYLISAVSYDSERQIISLKRHKDTGDEIGPGEIVDKATVASDIVNGMSYVTIYETLSKWKMGEKIHSSRVDNHFCLRIDGNKVKHDYLGSISELNSKSNPAQSGKMISSKKTENNLLLQITPEDKAMLKNMGASQKNSIMSLETNTEKNLPKLKPIKNSQKSKNEVLAEYEKSYLDRLGYVDANTSKEITPESPHGTLPKGFDKQSTKTVEPEVSKPKEATKEITPESPHGTLPKQIKSEKIQKKIIATDKQTEALGLLEKQIGDLKKAVDELDDKTEDSQKPKSQNSSDIQAYCVKCKTKRQVKDPIQTELKNGRPAIKGTCMICGTRMSRLGKLK